MTSTIHDATRSILDEIAPEEADLLGVVSAGFFGSATGRDRAVRSVLAGSTGDDPVGFDAATGAALLSALILTILNGVTCEVLAAGITSRTTGWWQRRKLRRQLAGRVAAQGADTPLPQLSSVDAAEVGRLAYQLAVESKVDPERAQRVANLIAARLTRPA
ncbi:hypothetical protein [Catellatospora chokoriensis]|uniref:Uncharacterized protein n=1 Tax=Catellatospora chokoriensis TaxID=310353 RepID=A0A8J3NUD4_9ACTN|nr:hypothetical protein [Catellatospora chokoriensis]GIF91145.1 hypothetical protein Cch02nite_45890 [Catellatospora chokoriensis]